MKSSPSPVAALTGSIASGKSTAAKQFEELGARLIDADILARQVVEPRSAALQEIQDHFGPSILLDDGSLDRKALGNLVFGDRNKLHELEQILHPKIHALFREQLRDAKYSGAPLVLYVVPLLFEANLPRADFDFVISVVADDAIRKDRLCKRNNLSDSEAQSRMDAQLPQKTKVAGSDFVLENNSTEQELRTSVRKLFNRIANSAPNA